MTGQAAWMTHVSVARRAARRGAGRPRSSARLGSVLGMAVSLDSWEGSRGGMPREEREARMRAWAVGGSGARTGA